MPDNERHYWIAIRSADGTVTVFGPFLYQDAIEQREAIQQSGRPENRIGAVFAAASRASAEVNAKFYLPEHSG